ncbi:MAG: hypothetical protein F6K26_42290 [Moorea sp. SIO2I5]|nr:hypothetical protein [Moorena sp. SIO2I5]
MDQLYNQKANYELPCVYGAVTIGDEWRFFKLYKNVAYIDNDNYYIIDISKIIGIIVKMVKGEA